MEKTLTPPTVFDKNGNNTKALQDLINGFHKLETKEKINGKDVITERGVTIKIPAGKYLFNRIIMKSNVHLLIDPNAIIYVAKDNRTLPMGVKELVQHIFRFGGDGENKVVNASIECTDPDKQFTIDLTTNKYRFIQTVVFGNVYNFKLSGLKILEKRSRFQGIDLSPSLKPGGGFARPVKGTIEKINIINADYGYGLVQMHCGKNIFFKNLHGIGGTTLRLESDYRDVVAGSLVIEDVYAQNITAVNGNSAVTLSPHKRKNLKVTISDVKAYNCGWGVRVEDSFLKTTPNKQGSFDKDSSISDVKVRYGLNARVKKSHLDKYVCNASAYTKEINNLLPSTDQLGYKGPSVAGSLYESIYEIKFIPDEIDVLKNSIVGPPKVLSGKRDCTTTKAKDLLKLNNQVFIHQNDTNHLNIETNDLQSSFKIYNTLGTTVLKSNDVFNNKISVDISSLNKGVYLVKTFSSKGNKTTKFIKQ